VSWLERPGGRTVLDPSPLTSAAGTPAPLTDGWCTVCGEYGRGQWQETLSERHELISDHQGCPGFRPLVPQHLRTPLKRQTV